MKRVLVLCSLLSLGHAASSTTSSIGSGMVMSTEMPTSSMSSMATSTFNVSAAEYTITALPNVASQPACVFNCLIPIGLADPSNCDDVTNQCACLNAPVDAMSVLTDCVATVCKSSTSAYAAAATSLYESYCNSVFGTSQFSSAVSAAATAATATTSAVSSTVAETHSASATAKSGSVKRSPSLRAAGLCVIGGILSTIIAL
ncbi:uncharacterized protein CDV56_100873 [Aspergillus thermomutatus]|uniref:CFEM domain-containing protein n=1 Tax=Aspergillus thermomutatus TaxID=41047 RepID=A0A397HSE6_ASPTH|nr:uncharacterized protein CDV56_100873 [Aspergillus thermomutatus]RHZ64898.1 hypothetical protein CDV56_100873 [Aspergillus thermomutatus]